MQNNALIICKNFQRPKFDKFQKVVELLYTLSVTPSYVTCTPWFKSSRCGSTMPMFVVQVLAIHAINAIKHFKYTRP